MNPNLGLAGAPTIDPITFMVTLGGFIPSFYSIFYGLCLLFGFFMLCNAIWRQTATANGRSEHTGLQNLGHALMGACLAVLGQWVGALGQGVFGTFQDASVLLYVARDERNLTKVAIASFLSLVQVIGAIGCFSSLRLSDRLATGKPMQGETWSAAFWFGFGGLCCVFIQQSIGIFSAMTGLGVSRFINSL